MKKNIALIGAGNWGKNHLRNLHSLGVLNSVLELSEEITTLRSGEYPGLKFTMNADDIINNSEIKAVVIAEPAHLHYKLSKNDLNAGKDVLVENPMSLHT